MLKNVQLIRPGLARVTTTNREVYARFAESSIGLLPKYKYQMYLCEPKVKEQISQHKPVRGNPDGLKIHSC